GTMVLNEVQGSDGGSVSIANLPKGIYLLRANRQTVKIIKK
ncbi:MAG: T9SS type A sorting domain-containing protein, partial [Bacteroidaceae bacterium]|nr:T9SS type A sorting domain-containing protein [Bacteroidaceae bacterium]